MKYVPSLPPPVTGVPDRVEVQALAVVGPARPVQPRSLPPLVTRRSNPVHSTPTETALKLEKRVAEPLHQDRRVYCRRFLPHSPLIELRSSTGRRKIKQRGDDKADNIDEFA